MQTTKSWEQSSFYDRAEKTIGAKTFDSSCQ